MGLHTPNQYNMTPGKCHICHGDVREDQYAIDHMGDGTLLVSKADKNTLYNAQEGTVSLWFHPECATVMALRLAHDVMKIKTDKDQPMRVVDALKSVSKINQAR